MICPPWTHHHLYYGNLWSLYDGVIASISIGHPGTEEGGSLHISEMVP